jgi:hypothetical protein
MMNEIERIADQLQRAYGGPAWHGPSVLEALEGVTATVGAQRPIEQAHSIWELVHHIGAWADIPRRRILGENFEVTMDLNFPPVTDTSDVAWQKSLAGLSKRQQDLLALIGTLSADALDRPVTKDGPTLYVLLHGVAQHHIYHAGQIALLKKSARASE